MVEGTQKSSQFVQGAFPLTNQTLFFSSSLSPSNSLPLSLSFLCEVEAALFLFFLLDSFPNFASYFSIKASNSTMTYDQFYSALLQAESAIDPMYVIIPSIKRWGSAFTKHLGSSDPTTIEATLTETGSCFLNHLSRGLLFFSMRKNSFKIKNYEPWI